MFGIMKTVSEVTSKEIKTIIDKDTHIVGNINGDGSLRVDGTVDGDITLDGCVFIGESGRVNGSITADELTISGFVFLNEDHTGQMGQSVSGTETANNDITWDDEGNIGMFGNNIYTFEVKGDVLIC